MKSSSAGELKRVSKKLLVEIKKKDSQLAELTKLRRLYAFISQVNQKIVRVKDQQTLFKNACAIAVRFGKFKIAWIGLFVNDDQLLNCVRQIGIPAEDLKYFKDFSIAETGPQKKVLNTGDCYIRNDIFIEPEFKNWVAFVDKHKICSFIILPIKKAGIVIGTFNLYSVEPGFFKKEEVALLLEVTGDISFALDMFERANKQKLAEEQVNIVEKRYKFLIEKSFDIKTLSNADGEIIYCSPSVNTQLGYTVDEFIHRSMFDLLHPDDILKFKKDRDTVLTTPGTTVYYQRRMLHKNGSWIWCEGSTTNMLAEPGIHGLLSNYRNITDKKIREQEREFDQNNLTALINNTNDLMWSIDTDFNLITANKPFNEMTKRMLGKQIEKGRSLLDSGFSDHQKLELKKNADRVFSGEAFRVTEHNKYPTESWSDIAYSPIIKGTEIVGATCHTRDITGLKIAEQKNLQSEARLMEAQAITHTGNYDIDTINHVEVWSDEMYRIYGINKMEHEPSPELFFSFIHPDDVDYVRARIDRTFKDLESASTEFRFIRHDGALRYGCSETKLERNQNHKISRFYGTMQDITQRKLAELEYTKMINDLSIRNKDLEQFGYIISHNLRAPVANIIGASVALKDPELSSQDIVILNDGINSSAMKLDQVIQDLNQILQVTGTIDKIDEKIILSELVEDIKGSVQLLIDKYHITLSYDFSEANHLFIFKPYLYSIFYNLILNSVKYRRMDISCIIHIKSHQLKNKVELIFQDNGTGIDLQKHGNSVFGLYKRFHEHIEGKGMGLFMVKTQVDALGGKISIQSAPNRGTEFTIELTVPETRTN
ncbi:PAS domain S-box protein [Mucilaginibacter sp.]|uniref:PAS domain S-box protein n=1 Tax=Mucilaginibacter sp. TaxID=1882438 RepID=UPI003265566E